MPSYIGYRPQFEPISLQEYLAVPTTVLGEYAKAEDAYNETANKAEALKALLGERNADNEAGWKIVDRYEQQLGDLADNISKGIQGPEAYRQAKGASRYYRENMLPLESGIPAYQEELKKWNADPTMIGSKPVLESYIKNPLYRAQMMSGNAIQAEAMKAAAIASDRRKQETKDRLIREGQNYSYYELTGFDPKEQQDYYLNPNAVPELKQLEDSITDKYVQQGYNDADARRYAKLGIIEGITYDRKRHDAKNENYETPLQRAARLKAERDSQKTPKPDGWNTAPKIYDKFIEVQNNLPDIEKTLNEHDKHPYGKEYSPFNKNGYLKPKGTIAKQQAPSMAMTSAKTIGENLENQIYTILDYYNVDYNHRTLTKDDIKKYLQKYKNETDFSFGRAIANKDIDKETSTDLQQNLQGYSVYEVSMNDDGTYDRGELLKKNNDFFNEKKFTIRQVQYDQYTNTLLVKGGLDKTGKSRNLDKIYEVSLDRVGYVERQRVERLSDYWRDAMRTGDTDTAEEYMNAILSIVNNVITLNKTVKQ